MPKNAPVAIVTGASRGLGLALARALAARGWRLVIDARGADALERARADLAAHTDVAALAGDVTDPRHREALVAAAGDRIDLLVNNASRLGPSPQPPLHAYPLAELGRVYLTNVLAPLALAQLALPRMDEGATILNISSDAAVEVYEGWGGYGSLKAAPPAAPGVVAGAAPARARRGASGAAHPRRRPRRHADADAPGRLPRRGHLGPPAARGARPGA